MEGKKYPCSLVESGKVKAASLHVRKPSKKRLYVLPFVLGYVTWILLAGFLLNRALWNELWLVPLVLLTFVHVLTILACQWSVKWDAAITCRAVGSVQEAELILVIPREHGGKAALSPIERDAQTSAIHFSFQRQKFMYNADRKCFQKLHYPTDFALGEYARATGLLNETTVEEHRSYYGLNRFEMHIPSFMELFKEHAVAPFFVFQVFCVGLWCLDEYWYYSVFTLVMLVVFESTVVQQRLRNMSEFRAMSLPVIDVMVRRAGSWERIKSNQLLPGDLVQITPPPVSGAKDGNKGKRKISNDEEDDVQLTLPCDMLLISGTCIINEAMISGESTPMLKESVLESCQVDELEHRPLNFDMDRNHILFGGTKVLQITSPVNPSIKDCPIGPSSYCVAYVLRTGFNTLQGKLVRTMMFTSERMTANNAEAFAFILFLLVFAIAAAVYVAYNVWADEHRSRMKLLLECTLIITAVVPPELPMELSLAVNNSLMALAKFAIYCMEPFRIPLAGKLDVCCFDKTGTLTGENLVVQGVAGLPEADPQQLRAEGASLPAETALIIATCHSLFKLTDGGDKIVGDPMERTAVEFVGWRMTRNDSLSCNRDGRSARILHRFSFSSALKRMSCIVQTGTETIIVAKGAPEVLEPMIKQVPPWYRDTFTRLAHRGARILSLAYKRHRGPTLTAEKAKQYSREQAESDLIFAGFLVFHCPLKSDSKRAIQSLIDSLHHVVMITGDNVLTAVHTAYELDMARADQRMITIDMDDKGEDLVCRQFNREGDADTTLSGKVAAIPPSAVVAITGDAYDWLARRESKKLDAILVQITVFARASPGQKEAILTRYKAAGYTTLMCGDGTNDVGALKQAHVGVALLGGRPEDLARILAQGQTVALRKRQLDLERSRLAIEERWGAAARGDKERALQMQQRIEQLTGALDQEEVPMVKLGDASVAAPFTSKISTIEAVSNLIRQGRCTLVTTMQMYKILALNSLISAYGLSVLHLEGIRYGDFQVTVTGMLLAGCFLFLSKSQPVQRLAPTRPQPNILNWYVLTSVLGQFALHTAALWLVVRSVGRWSFPMIVDENTRFSPSLLNTAVYLVSLLMQVSTFVVNYQGRPFRESLSENIPLRNCLAAVGAISVIAAMELYPEANTWLQLVPMPPAFRRLLLLTMAADFGGCLLIEWLAKRLLFDARPKIRPTTGDKCADL